ncbi:hypothetical protein [Portibacter lacus]|uniref:Lipoprotein n=1 Tax=Portibacter lacus TaxID=1099794 RepID=A0AA37SR33_9BACT|nr:hypothetical protein [Portibacter lacus]GLR18184.1 hypothetical protein GCM10007940_27990 [Portibacter lacus]
MKVVLKILTLILIFSACKQVQTVESDSEIAEKQVVQVEKIVEAKTPVETRMNKEFILGTWQNIDHKDINFILNLNVDKDFVAGEYCSKALKFFLEDCAGDDGGEYCSVRGPLNSLNIEIGMESCITAEVSKGEIQRQDSIIVLTLVESAGEYGKDHLVPKSLKLKKISNEPFL